MTEEASPVAEVTVEQPAESASTFTQEQVDRMVQDRLARERKKYEGFDELRQKAEQFDQLQEQRKTEVQKAQERAQKAEEAAQARVEAANERLIQAAVLSAATNHRAIKPEHLYRLIDREAVTVGDDGQVTGAEDAVKAFLDANPEYVGSTRPNGFADQGARNAMPPRATSMDELIRGRAGR